MLARLGPAQAPPAPGVDVITRAVGTVALAALAMIHVIDLPATLSPTPLVGIGYLAIIAGAIGVGAVMMLVLVAAWQMRARAGAVTPQPATGDHRNAHVPA
jgi:hypothetical protein